MSPMYTPCRRNYRDHVPPLPATLPGTCPPRPGATTGNYWEHVHPDPAQSPHPPTTTECCAAGLRDLPETQCRNTRAGSSRFRQSSFTGSMIWSTVSAVCLCNRKPENKSATKAVLKARISNKLAGICTDFRAGHDIASPGAQEVSNSQKQKKRKSPLRKQHSFHNQEFGDAKEKNMFMLPFCFSLPFDLPRQLPAPTPAPCPTLVGANPR